jgi:ferritin-like metal-binding protein YciE
MSRPKSFKDLFLDEARDLYSAEQQLTQAFPKLAEVAESDEVRAEIEIHLEQTRTHIQRLEEVFELLGERPDGQHCAGMARILQATTNAIDEEDVQHAGDGGIVVSAQRVAHYKIGAYGSLVAAATTLGTDAIATILRRTLEEEKAADETSRSLREHCEHHR